MKTVRTLLYVFSALFMLSVVFVFAPWDWLNAFMALFGEYVYPDDPLVQYTVRLMMALAFWIGVLMAVAVYQAENNPLFLLILGLTFLSLAPVTVGLVWVYQLPLLFYSDAVSSVVVGVLFLVYRGQVTSRGASTAGTVS
jgi:hypothetical protein